MLYRAALGTVMVGALSLLASGCTTPAPFRVMSFNVRYAAEDDGPNHWDLRRDQVIATIRAGEPDVVALQEVLCSQAVELRSAFPEYGFVGVGREDGAEKGEFVPILFSRKRFTLTDYGHFWLSEQPERVGSVGWDAALPRIATWACLRFKDATLTEVRVVNVHFDHRGPRARVESAKLLRRLVEATGGRPLIVLGDFNCGPDSEPYKVLTEERGNLTALRDAHARCCPPGKLCGTYHGLTGRPHAGRIDWILVNRRFAPVEADIDCRCWEGRFPSDRSPVTAKLRWRTARAGFT